MPTRLTQTRKQYVSAIIPLRSATVCTHPLRCDELASANRTATVY